MDHEQAFQHAVWLAGDGAPRLAATPAAREAERRLTGFFSDLGLRVDRQQFRQPAYGAEGSSLRARIDGAWVELDHVPVWFAGDTGDEPVRAPLVHIGNGSEGYVAGRDLTGKALLVSRDSYLEYPDDLLYRRLLRWKPAMVLLTTNAGAHGPLDTFFDWEKTEHEPAPPAAVIHYREATRLVQAEAEVELEYRCRYDVQESTCANLIATLDGADPEAGGVIVSAHYDTAPSTAGALDNAGGSAMVMTLAQRLVAQAAAGDRPRRSVHFVLFSGHESGLHGPRSLVTNRPELVAETAFILNFDVVGAPIHLNTVYGIAAPSVIDEVRAQVDALGFDWPVSAAVVPYDPFAFCGAGVPWINLGQGLTNWLHTDQDTVDRLHPEGFRAPLAFSDRVLAWATGDAAIERGYPESLTAAIAGYVGYSGWATPTPSATGTEA